MPSKPPLLPSPSASRSGEPSRTIGAARLAVSPCSSAEPSRINWSAILASVSVSFALVVAVIAWIVTHPKKAPAPLESPIVAVVAPAIETSANPPAPPVSPAPGLVCATETIPALDRPDRLEKIANPLPLVEETPPPLPPPAPPRPQPEPQPAAVQAAPQPAGETYGTQVLFLNNQEAAADLARHDRKLLFVMHISGNFEDSCFT